MHGFPDNVHLYDRLSPYLSPPRRVVLFDFLGWGSSNKPSGYPYTTDNQVGDLDAVITQLGLGEVVLVAHDASGPPVIDWALAHPDEALPRPPGAPQTGEGGPMSAYRFQYLPLGRRTG
jgi:pimeloyl-ACP methyl ester carboxylesterase